MPVKEVTGVVTGTAKEAVAATAAITNTLAGTFDDFIEKGIKTEGAVGFKLGGRTCRATLILEILHAEEPKAIS
jgi:hypothetical protein